MDTNKSRLLIIALIVIIFILVSIALNAATLSIMMKRFDELSTNATGNQVLTTTSPMLSNLSLVNAMRINDVMMHLGQIYRIALEENGTRAINTRGFNRTLDYITNYLSTHTNYHINKTYFPVKDFKLLSDPILITSINGIIKNRTFSNDLSKAEFYYLQYSTAIDLTNFVELTVIPNSACSNDDWLNASPPPNDRIVLVPRGTCDFVEKVTLAIKHNAKGFLIYNDGISSNRIDPIATSLDQTNHLPALFLSFHLGQELVDAFNSSSRDVSIRMIINVQDVPSFPVGNICADTPTGDITQTIVIGSHSDSVPAGPGINDNGSGSVANLALALALFETSIYKETKYRLRFCWWGAEEIGLLGSDFYVNQAKTSTVIGERISDNLLNINLDMLGSPNYVFGIYDGETITNATPAQAIPGSKKITSLFRNWFKSQNLPWSNSTLGSGSDYAPFLAAGVAAGGLLSGAGGIKTKEQCDQYAPLLGDDPYCIPNLPYDLCYHKPCDTIWNINVFAYEKMIKSVAYVIDALIHMDNLKEWLYPSREIRKLKFNNENERRKYNSINEYFQFPYA